MLGAYSGFNNKTARHVPGNSDGRNPDLSGDISNIAIQPLSVNRHLAGEGLMRSTQHVVRQPAHLSQVGVRTIVHDAPVDPIV
jgi:hypothetical protein